MGAVAEDKAARRIRKELEHTDDWEEVRNWGISFDAANDKLNFFKAKIAGPQDTPYEGGTFTLDIKIPRSYPFVAPNVRYVTKIWHPNVCSVSGVVNVEPAKESSMTLLKYLVSLQAALSTADPNHPGDVIVAKQYEEDPDMFGLTAKHWARAYAGAPGCIPDFSMKIAQLMEMGVDEDTVRSTLSSCSWDIEKAAERLCENIFYVF